MLPKIVQLRELEGRVEVIRAGVGEMENYNLMGTGFQKGMTKSPSGGQQ